MIEYNYVSSSSYKFKNFFFCVLYLVVLIAQNFHIMDIMYMSISDFLIISK